MSGEAEREGKTESEGRERVECLQTDVSANTEENRGVVPTGPRETSEESTVLDKEAQNKTNKENDSREGSEGKLIKKNCHWKYNCSDK